MLGIIEGVYRERERDEIVRIQRVSVCVLSLLSYIFISPLEAHAQFFKYSVIYYIINGTSLGNDAVVCECVRDTYMFTFFLRYDIISLRQLTNGANHRRFLLSSSPPPTSSSSLIITMSSARSPRLPLYRYSSSHLRSLFYSLLFTRASMLKLHRFAAGGGCDGGGAGISQES